MNAFATSAKGAAGAAMALGQPAPETGAQTAPVQASWPVEIAGEALVCDASGALWWPGEETLIVSDLHLEKGSSLARRGMLIPPYDSAATLGLLEAAIARLRPRTVIALGDSFHDNQGHERLPGECRDRLGAMMEGRQWVWIAGNHDETPPVSLGGIAASQFLRGALTFRHEPSPAPQPGEIAGHLHPCARLVRRGRAIRRACFVHDGTRMIMPSFGAYTGGLNIRDNAFAGLFDKAGRQAVLLGRDRVYPVAMRHLAGG